MVQALAVGKSRAPSSTVSCAELVLKIVGSSRDGQIVRLRSPKCAIGSSSNCALRLVARGVRPVHCLILRGTGPTTIRCLGPDTRLNGGLFTDAPLVVGDRLGIGPLEFEVVESGRLQVPAAVAPQETSSKDEQTSQNTARELAVEKKDLAEQRRELHQREAQWRAEQARANKETERTEQQLEEQRRELRIQQEALEHERAQWNAQEMSREALPDVEEEVRQLRQQQEELAATSHALEEERRRMNQNRQCLEESRRTNDSGHAGIDALTGATSKLELRSPPASGTGEERGTSFDLDEALDSIGLGEATAEEAFPSPAPTTMETSSETFQADRNGPPAVGKRPGNSRGTLSQPEPVGEPLNEEESQFIEDYMSRLLNRDQPADERAELAEANKEDAKSSKVDNRRLEEDAYVPRAVAPEQASRLDAMRELAKTSAANAIGEYAKRRLIASIRSKMRIVVAAVVILGIVTTMFWGIGAVIRTALALVGLTIVGLGSWSAHRALRSRKARAHEQDLDLNRAEEQPWS